MTLKQSWVSRAVRALKISTAGIALLATAGGLTAGCLDRPVAPATPRTSNVVVKTVTQSGVDKIDLLFMIDNSISMADKQRILSDAVPVLVQRLVDPICVNADGDPVGGTNNGGCAPNTPEFSPIEDIHIGIITSSLGNHGGEVCVDDPTAMPPRTLNDMAQLIGSVRSGIYSYTGLGPHGFLVWDPRVGDDRPVPETHPGLSNHETDPQDFVADFAAHVAATGERGCGYEASLEAWYRFLIDPEPISQVTLDPTGQFSQRGPINTVVLEQRAAFLRPDSLLAIIMLTDENDCSIDDENGHQGWLVGRRSPMPRGSDACARPDNPDIYRCCIPCVLLEGGQLPAGCDYSNDQACNAGHYLMPAEDSTNLRCYQQVRRFGLNLLYPWDRYSVALKAPRIRLRALDANGNPQDVPNPLYTPGMDGTPAREPGLVFLAGIIGVPWQDIATGESLNGPGLTYLTAPELRNPPTGTMGGNRWDVILGDPDTGRLPSDPFMHETVAPRSGTNPITGDAIMPPAPGNMGNDINGHEQNIVNQDDLQYACTFDLEPDVPCTMANTDGCDCNASEQAYNRPLCTYAGMGDGVQTHAKAYPGVRHLQVLRGFGDNAIVASICPKNPERPNNPASDPNYGYNPAVGAIIDRLKEALVATCLPRPLAEEEEGVPCTVVEALLPTSQMCNCNDPGRLALEGETAKVRDAVIEELKVKGLCGGSSGIPCEDYCMCEIEQFTGAELANCQSQVIDSDTQHGYCYVDFEDPAGPDLLKDCPETQQQIIRFMGEDVPKAGAIGFIACLGASVTAGTTDGGM